MENYGLSWRPKYCQARTGRPNCILGYRASQSADNPTWSNVVSYCLTQPLKRCWHIYTQTFQMSHRFTGQWFWRSGKRLEKHDNQSNCSAAMKIHN
eukprot:12050567-Karenia_brevis.AAC.1